MNTVSSNTIESSDTNKSTLLDHADEVLDSMDFGLAIFDSDLQLITHNRAYQELCGYADDQVEQGTNLRDMIDWSLAQQGMTRQDIDISVNTALLRLKSENAHTFHFKTKAGRNLAITRTPKKSGRVVELVREVVAYEGLDPNSSQLHHLARIAHARMVQALNVIGDGFAMYDQEDKLVFYNQKYIDLNPHIADLIKPGAYYADMLRKGIERGGIVHETLAGDALVDLELQNHLNPGEPSERQLADGRWVRVQEQRTEDGGIVGIRSDITDIKNRELDLERLSIALDQKTDQFDVALNNMIQGLCMFDAEQRLLLCNRQYLEMYGFSADVVKPGILLSDIMKYSISLGNYRPEDAQAALNTRHDPDRLRKRTVIKQHLRDGRVMAVMNEPMTGGGSIATYQDITDSEKNEERLLAYNRKLERSNKELQEFAYVASHDLQEPLRKIEAFGDRLSSKHGDKLPEDGQMYIERMQNASSRMRQLINDLLSYSRVTTKARPFESVDLNEILEGVASDLQIRIQEAKGKLEWENLPEIQADATQMRQLMQNLISNAFKFRKPDTDPIVKVTAEEHSLTDEAGNRQDFWRIRVADNGIGFDNTYKDQIFAIFQRLHGRLEYEGTGIGLATCRKIVERHNGKIDADGVPDEGATFLVDIPCSLSSNQE